VGEFFFVLGEKMGRNLEKFRKIPKMSGKKKNNFFLNPCHWIRHLHINPAATLFFWKNIFFLRKVGGFFFSSAADCCPSKCSERSEPNFVAPLASLMERAKRA
jgi:hypothetical protein